MAILKKKIVTHLSHRDYRPVKSAALAKSLGVEKSEIETFKKVFQQLCTEGLVIIGSKNLVSLPPVSGKIQGTFRAAAKGFGFVTPTRPKVHGDLFIPADETSDAMTGDTVVAKVVKETRRGKETRYSGKIIEILHRANNRFVGTVIKKGDGYYLLPEGKFTALVAIDDLGAKNAQPGDKTVVEIISFPTQQNLARGVIVEVLGKSGTYKTEINACLRRFNLPDTFEDKCLQAASEQAKDFNPDDFAV